MGYRAPVEDIAFFLKTCTSLPQLMEQGLVDLTFDVVEPILEEGGKFAATVIAPLDRIADREGNKFKDGAVTTFPGSKDAYTQWREAGWNSTAAEEEWGGQHLPNTVTSALTEFWNAACNGFSIGGILTQGSIETISAHGTEEQKKTYLEKLVSGEWTGTMNLTEPTAGSDLNNMRTKAVRAGDGTYRITGEKIFITYGENDWGENIVHLVLARLPDAPAGTKGISLFIVPKYLVNADGSLGARNDAWCTGIEHKLGLHGSPTATMTFGANSDGAIGYLLGQENKGLNAMFIMMNNARLAVGLQGVGVAERATQHALEYARERRMGYDKAYKGEGMAPIIYHPDVKRMLLTMRAETNAARYICLNTADALDRSRRLTDPKERAHALAVASLLTPIAKAYSTDIGIEVSSVGVQVYGGMGFIEESGAPQYYRDSRIFAIYEGTNGIHAIDLVTRKIGQEEGAVVRDYIAGFRKVAEEVKALALPEFGNAGQKLADTVDALERCTKLQLERLAGGDKVKALVVSTPYLRLFARAAGGAYLAQVALAAQAERAAGNTDPRHAGRIAIARFYAENLCPQAAGLEDEIQNVGATLESEAVLSLD